MAIIAVVSVFVLIVVSVMAYVGLTRLNGSLSTPNVQSLPGGIPCDQLEHSQVHYHAALQIINQGNSVPIPTGVGRTLACYYWLHMHTGEPGIIHVEAPADRTFTLGDFFAVWSAWAGTKELLDATHVSSFTLTGDQKLMVYVDPGDGAGPAPFSGDPQSIELKNREVITLEITPPGLTPPPAYSWPPGF